MLLPALLVLLEVQDPALLLSSDADSDSHPALLLLRRLQCLLRRGFWPSSAFLLGSVRTGLKRRFARRWEPVSLHARIELYVVLLLLVVVLLAEGDVSISVAWCKLGRVVSPRSQPKARCCSFSSWSWAMLLRRAFTCSSFACCRRSVAVGKSLTAVGEARHDGDGRPEGEGSGELFCGEPL